MSTGRIFRAPDEIRERQEQRRVRISRLRTRLANIEPNDTTDTGLDTIAVIGTIKGVLDILADDGEGK